METNRFERACRIQSEMNEIKDILDKWKTVINERAYSAYFYSSYKGSIIIPMSDELVKRLSKEYRIIAEARIRELEEEFKNI